MASLAIGVAAPLDDSVLIREGARILWDFDRGVDGWSVKHSITGLGASKGCLRGTVNGSDPYVKGPTLDAARFKDTAGVVVRIWMSSEGPLELYWKNEKGDYSESRHAVQQVPGQQWTTVRFDLRTHPEWNQKTINGIRLDPGSVGTSFAIDYVGAVDHLNQPEATWLSWANNFEANLEGWTVASQVSNFLWEEGKLKGKTSGANPLIASPPMSQSGAAGVMVQFKSDADCSLQLYWSTVDGVFSEAKSKSLLHANKGGWQLLKFDLRDHPEWIGKTITNLRLQPGKSSGQSFEIDSVMFVNAEAFDDSDGDFLDGISELAFGTDPQQSNRLPGRLTNERWNGLNIYSTRDMVRNHEFYTQPDWLYFGSPASNPFYYEVCYFFTRSRGYIIAPKTGNYRFWISGSSGVELWLSSDEGKFAKSKIAEMNPEIGTGYGVYAINTNRYDCYASQMSQDVYLVAGSKYYVEALQSTGHVGTAHMSIAWAPPGESRQALPSNWIESYAPIPTDADDDGLPDAWEATYGLSPLDSGFFDLLKQGEYGDFDSDGLGNYEEFLRGTNPALADTDGDGIGDYEEIYQYSKDPLVSDRVTDQQLLEINVVGDLLNQGTWQIFGNRLISTSYRNDASWNLNVPADGMFQVEMELKLVVSNMKEATTSFLAEVDGVPIGRSMVHFGANDRARVSIDLPFLRQGAHVLKLKMDGYKAIGTVSIEGLSLNRPGGLDMDGDGTADAQQNAVKQRSHLSDQSSSSIFSPYLVEGVSPAMQSMTIQANGARVEAQKGVGTHGWKAEINLSDTPVNLNVAFENGGVSEQRVLTWSPLDLSKPYKLHARCGDALKFEIPTSAGGRVEVMTPNGVSELVALNAQVGTYQFSAGGVYLLRWFDSSGKRTESQIIVHAADLTADTAGAVKGNVRDVIVTGGTVDLAADGGDAFQILVRKPSTSSETFTLAMRESGMANLGFRDAVTGRLVSLLPIDVIEVSDVLSSMDYRSFDSGITGAIGVTYGMVFSDLPPGWSIDVSIFKGGVTFRDGTVNHTFTSADLSNGILSLEFLHTADLSGGLCHRFTIRDSSGRVVW